MLHERFSCTPASLFCTLCGTWTAYDPGSPGSPGRPGSPVVTRNSWRLTTWISSQSARSSRNVPLSPLGPGYPLSPFGPGFPGSPGMVPWAAHKQNWKRNPILQTSSWIEQQKLWWCLLTSEELHEVGGHVAIGTDDPAVTRWPRRSRWTRGALNGSHASLQWSLHNIVLQQALICREDSAIISRK